MDRRDSDDELEFELVGVGREGPEAAREDGGHWQASQRPAPQPSDRQQLRNVPMHADMLAPLHVWPCATGWALAYESGQVIRAFDARDEALTTGRRMAERRGLPLVVHARRDQSSS